jgi:hypothetical protein
MGGLLRFAAALIITTGSLFLWFNVCHTIVAAPVSSVSLVDGRVYFTSEGQINRCHPDGNDLATFCPATDLLKFSVPVSAGSRPGCREANARGWPRGKLAVYLLLTGTLAGLVFLP